MKTVNKLIALAIFPLCLGSLPAFAVTDSEISSTVSDKIQSNAVTSGSKINVTTDKGIVNLAGNVETAGEASSAIESANSVKGVKDVDTDKLTVKDSSNMYKDAYITAKVKGSFLREELFGDKPVDVMSISVETIDGVVHLTGTAQSKAQEDNAITIAREIKGVKSVESKLSMKE